MTKRLFVSFNDDDTDPTFTTATGASLVLADGDTDDNPCASSTARHAPCAPRTAEDIEAFAAVMGWAVETDNDGNLVLYTNVQADDDADADD